MKKRMMVAAIAAVMLGTGAVAFAQSSGDDFWQNRKPADPSTLDERYEYGCIRSGRGYRGFGDYWDGNGSDRFGCH